MLGEKKWANCKIYPGFLCLEDSIKEGKTRTEEELSEGKWGWSSVAAALNRQMFNTGSSLQMQIHLRIQRLSTRESLFRGTKLKSSCSQSPSERRNRRREAGFESASCSELLLIRLSSLLLFFIVYHFWKDWDALGWVDYPFSFFLSLFDWFFFLISLICGNGWKEKRKKKRWEMTPYPLIYKAVAVCSSEKYYSGVFLLFFWE